MKGRRYSLRYYPAVMGTPPMGVGTWMLIRDDGSFEGQWFTWSAAIWAVFRQTTPIDESHAQGDREQNPLVES